MRRKKILAIILLLAFFITNLPSEMLKHSDLKYEYEEYSEDEFPLWTNEIRRAETLFFGSFVFTIPIAGLSLNALRRFNVISSSTSTEKDALLTLSVAASLSLFVATLDWVIGKVQN